jgi:NAD(P)-dependent dehydrogenase (short-subunit alcohol dehydrogenase family)
MENRIKKIVITGTNRGIGYSIIEKFFQSAKMDNMYLICTARNVEAGQKAISEFKEKNSIFSNNLIFHQLDVTDSESILKFKEFMLKNHPEFDILINNAGVCYHEEGDEENLLEIVNKTLSVNVKGQIDLTESLLELIRDGGQIINISSSLGVLKMNKKIQERFLDIENITEEKFLLLQNEFVESTKKNTWEDDGWVNGSKLNNVYSISKAFLNLYTRMLNKRLNIIGKNIKVNSCSPGHCRTDMGGPNAPRSALEGADTPVWLASFPTQKDESLTGNYYRERINLPFYLS